MPTMGVSTLQHLGKFGITSIGILSAGYAGNSGIFTVTRDGREDSSNVMRIPIGTCSSTRVLEYFHAVK